MRSVRMHPALAVGVGAVVLLLLVGYALTQKSVYQAVSQVYEEPAAAKLLADSGSANNFDANRYETFLGEQMQLVQRLGVLTTALTALPEATWREYGDTAQQAAETIQQQMKVVRVATSLPDFDQPEGIKSAQDGRYCQCDHVGLSGCGA